jgi:hypothetical protein
MLLCYHCSSTIITTALLTVSRMIYDPLLQLLFIVAWGGNLPRQSPVLVIHAGRCVPWVSAMPASTAALPSAPATIPFLAMPSVPVSLLTSFVSTQASFTNFSRQRLSWPFLLCPQLHVRLQGHSCGRSFISTRGASFPGFSANIHRWMVRLGSDGFNSLLAHFPLKVAFALKFSPVIWKLVPFYPMKHPRWCASSQKD